MSVRYDDWTVTQRHREVVQQVAPPDTREIQIARDIPGVIGRRITDGFRAGIFIKPFGSDVIQKFSIVQDIRRYSLLVAGFGKSSTQERETPLSMRLAEAVRTLFADKRVTGYDCELSSSHELQSYDIDANVARQYDVVIIQLSSTLREDR